jgi:hypothetical protein
MSTYTLVLLPAAANVFALHASIRAGRSARFRPIFFAQAS